MRGGTAHVTVIISDEEIGSPITRHPDAVLALNGPSLEKYQSLLKPGGILVYNSSLVADLPQPIRADIRVIAIPASDIATQLGDIKMANMVGLGALIAATDILPLAALGRTLHHHLPKEKQKLVAANEHALEYGARLGQPVPEAR
jgi:2-oxoglutarate ferredoxin oxidoreductase subunit gamma